MLYTPVTELTGAKLTTPLQFPVLAESCTADKGTRFSSDSTCDDVPFFLGTLSSSSWHAMLTHFHQV